RRDGKWQGEFGGNLSRRDEDDAVVFIKAAKSRGYLVRARGEPAEIGVAGLVCYGPAGLLRCATLASRYGDADSGKRLTGAGIEDRNVQRGRLQLERRRNRLARPRDGNGGVLSPETRGLGGEGIVGGIEVLEFEFAIGLGQR